MHNDNWQYIGKLNEQSIPDIDKELFNLPVIVGEGQHYHNKINNENNIKEFWFQRDYASLKSYNGPYLKNYYYKLLNMPEYEKTAVTFMLTTDNVGWHTDWTRNASINILVQSGGFVRTEFENGTSFVMNKGDIYALNVQKKHRVIFISKPEVPRIIISVSLPHAYESEHSQNTINYLKNFYQNKENNYE